MRRSSRVSRLLLWALLAPLLISSGGLTCQERTGDTHLSSLEIEVEGMNVIGAFDPALRVYDVWLPAGATTATVRAQPMDPAARVTWYTSLATGAIGVGGGEASIDIPPDGTQLFIGVFPPGGATDTYIVAFNPACPVGQSCSNGGLAGQCVADVCVADGIARIEITPAAAVLTDIGASHQLTAQAYNAAGQAVGANFTWTSSHPDHAIVDSDGLVAAASSLGSTAIVATADGVDSPAAIVTIASPAPGAVFVLDQQVASAPKLEDPTVQLGLGSRIELSLQGMQAPDVGDILLPQESLSVGGRVVDVQDAGQGVLDIVIEMIPLSEMYDAFAISETIPLPTDQAVISDAAAQYYDMARQPDGSFLFTLKPTPLVAKAARPLGPFSCESGAPGAIALDAFPPTINVDPSLDVIVEWDTDDPADERIVVVGQIKADLSAKVSLTVAIQASVECKFTAFELPFPVLGVPLFYAGATVPVGVGFSLAGALSAPVQFEVGVRPSATVTGGMRCPVGQDCNFFFSGDLDVAQTILTPTIDIGDPAFPLRVEPKVEGFVFAGLEMGVELLVFEFKVDLLQIKGGFVQSGSFATMDAQLDDPNYKSNFTLGVELSAGAGASVKKFLDYVEIKLGLPLAKISEQYAQSPTMASAAADVASYNLGDTVTFNVELDPNDVGYSLFGYNVDEIMIFERTLIGGGWTTEQVASVSATASGQTSFSVPWTPAFSGSIGDRFFAAVSTKLLPDMPFGFGNLELGKITPGVEEDCTTPADEDGDGFGMCDDMDSCSDHPSCVGLIEICGNEVDDDNNGATDCQDVACQNPAGLCEICSRPGTGQATGGDEDLDGLYNCEDPDCFASPNCEDCTDGVDNNGDRWVDCNDPQCRGIDATCGIDCRALGACSDPACIGNIGCDTLGGFCARESGIGLVPANIDISTNLTNDAQMLLTQDTYDCTNGLRWDAQLSLISTASACGEASVSATQVYVLSDPHTYEINLSSQNVPDVQVSLRSDSGQAVVDSTQSSLLSTGTLQPGEYELTFMATKDNCAGSEGSLSFSISFMPDGYVGEHCVNGLDDDGSGDEDCEDPACQVNPHTWCVGNFENCTNCTDDDDDGALDCEDSNCSSGSHCSRGADNPSGLIGKTIRGIYSGGEPYCQYFDPSGVANLWNPINGFVDGIWYTQGDEMCDEFIYYTGAPLATSCYSQQIACDRVYFSLPDYTIYETLDAGNLVGSPGCGDCGTFDLRNPTVPRANGSSIVGKTFRDETTGYCEYYSNGAYVGWDRSFGSYSGTWTYNGTVMIFDSNPDFQYTVAIACGRGLWFDYPENTPFANEGVFETGNTCQPFP